MAAFRNSTLAGAFAFALAGLLAGDAVAVAGGERVAGAPASTVWREVKWPFPIDQWGTGRAFRCSAADCGLDITLYLRAKLGFCNCSTGVSDDTELDRVGDLELLSEKFDGLREGRPIAVGWMRGRSRPYRVLSARTPSALAIAFNDKCDVVVATVVAAEVDAAERAALAFLNGDLVLRWAERELGL